MGLLINENEFTSKSGSSKLIGETFTTLRTGIIDGAVEQDGSQYNFSDYPEIETLLNNGDLPYIPINRFDTMVSEQGRCGCFGHDESGTFYGWSAPMYGGAYYTKSETPQVGDDLFQKENGVMEKHDTVYEIRDPDRIQIDWDGHSATRDTSLDETVPESTYFKVPKKVVRVLVRSQKPTADNDYTWYNLYSDGWVEQGGKITLNGVISDNNKTISLPVRMESTKYYSIVSQDANAGGTPRVTVGWQSTIKMTVGFVSTGGVNGQVSWEAKGYADSIELSDALIVYGRYGNNLNYERHMIQIK